jgi:hypothetical protein
LALRSVIFDRRWTAIFAEKETLMKSLLITAPILPGKLEVWRGCVREVLGARRAEYQTAIREGGLTRLRVWHQQGPDGADLAVVLYEGPAPEKFLARIATSKDPFSTWFREQLVEAHGLDLSKPPPPPPELEIDEGLTPPPTYSCSRVTVQHPTAWRKVMGELAPLRLEHGQVSEEILRSVDDEHEFMVLIGWGDEERARQYYAHPELRAGVERAGGVEGVGLKFLTPPRDWVRT